MCGELNWPGLIGIGRVVSGAGGRIAMESVGLPSMWLRAGSGP